jgi:hypothetical protein
MYIEFEVCNSSIEYIQDNNRLITEIAQHIQTELAHLLITSVEVYVNPIINRGVVKVLYTATNIVYPEDIIDFSFSINEDTYFVRFLC